MMEGYISLHRQIKEHWIFERDDYFKAWVIILMEVNHKPNKVLIKGVPIDCGRGQSLKSVDSWVLAFGKGWTRQKVRTFFKVLERDNMITIDSDVKKTTKLTVCKYDSYQGVQPPSNHHLTTQQPLPNHNLTTNNNDNNDNNDNKYTLDFSALLDYINEKTGRSFKVINEPLKKKYIARLKEGYVKADILNAINNTVNNQYHKDNNFQYLTPEFFSRANTLDKYGTISDKQPKAVRNLDQEFYDNVMKQVNANK